MNETIMVLLGVVGIFSFLYVLISALSKKRMSPVTKALWITAGLLFNVLTAIVYYFKYDSK